MEKDQRGAGQVNGNEKQFRSIIFDAPVAMSVYRGRDFVVEIANRRFLELVAKTEDQLLGKPLFETLPEVRASNLDILNGVFDSGEPFIANEFEVMLHRPGKSSTAYFNFIYQPEFGADGKVSAVFVVATEVTDMVVAKKKLTQSEERLRLAVEAGDLGTFEVDIPTNHTITSHRFHQIFGTDNETNRETFVAIIHPDDVGIRAKAYEVAAVTGLLEYDARLLRADGTTRWIRAKGKYLYDATGKPETLLGIIYDITEQKSFSDELGRQVDERTEELQAANEEITATNEELEESNSNLARANVELEQFTYAASHDLQEPLRKIQTFASRLLEISEDLTPKQKGYLTKILASSERMKAVMTDLLFYSNQGREDQVFVNCDLNDVVAAVLSDLELVIEQKQAKIEVEKLPVVGGIPGQLHQLFINLISNSLKFAKENEVPRVLIKAQKLSDALKFSRGHLDQSASYVHITIADNGIGFQQEFADYVFQLFKRLNRGNEYSGTGIGLALCKKTAENHNGDIFAESEPQKGTTVHVILRPL